MFLLWCCRCIILRIFLQVGRPGPSDGSPGPSRLGGQGGVFSDIFKYLLEKKRVVVVLVVVLVVVVVVTTLR